jgi:dTDP-4-amino-4,6-dideoxygalactose transaminase
MTCVPDGPWFYQQIELGFNYRMTDIQAALGLSQMQRLDEFVSKRESIASRYDEMLRDLWVKIPFRDPDANSAWHLYIVRLNSEVVKLSQRDVFERLRSFGILVNLHYIPIYRHPFYESMGYLVSDFPNAEKYYSEAMSLPIYPFLSSEQQNLVVSRMETPIGHQDLF